jgi:Outer membrane lipoprotein
MIQAADTTVALRALSRKIFSLVFTVALLAGLVVGSHAADSPDAQLFASGINDYQKGKYDAVITTMTEILSKYPQTPLRDMTLYWLARANFKVGNQYEAANHLSQFKKEYPDNPLAEKVEEEFAALVTRLEQGERLGGGTMPATKTASLPVGEPAPPPKEKIVITPIAEEKPRDQRGGVPVTLARPVASPELIEKAPREKIVQVPPVGKAATAEELFAGKAAADTIARERAEAERVAAAKVAEERLQAEQAEFARLSAVKAAELIAAAKAAAAKAEAERIVAEKTAAEQIAAARAAKEKADAERRAAEKMALEYQAVAAKALSDAEIAKKAAQESQDKALHALKAMAVTKEVPAPAVPHASVLGAGATPGGLAAAARPGAVPAAKPQPIQQVTTNVSRDAEKTSLLPSAITLNSYSSAKKASTPTPVPKPIEFSELPPAVQSEMEFLCFAAKAKGRFQFEECIKAKLLATP